MPLLKLVGIMGIIPVLCRVLILFLGLMAQDAYTEGKTTSSTTDLLCSGGKVTEEMDTR